MTLWIHSLISNVARIGERGGYRSSQSTKFGKYCFKRFLSQELHWSLAWYSTLLVLSYVPNLAIIREGVTTGPQTWKFGQDRFSAVFRCRGATLCTNHDEIWHEKVHHVFTLIHPIWLCSTKGTPLNFKFQPKSHFLLFSSHDEVQQQPKFVPDGRDGIKKLGCVV